MPERRERPEAPESSDHAAGDGAVAETLSRILESYYGARQLESDLELFPNALSAVQRRTLEDGLRTFRGALGPFAAELGRLLVSPSSTARLVSAVRSEPTGASRWEQFRARTEAFRDALTRATRALRVRRATGDFLEPEGDARSPGTEGTEAATLERDKRENEELLALEVLTAVTRPMSRPTRVLLDVTNKCNFRCRTCYQSHGQDFVSNDLDWLALDRLRTFMRTCKKRVRCGDG